jgi:hypothetical protein
LKIPGGEVLVRVAVGEDETADALGVAADQHLGHGAAGIVADDGDVVEVERLEEGGDRRRDPRRGEVGAGLHRDLLGAQRPVRRETAMALGKPVDNAVPKSPIDEVAVDENHGLATAGLAVADPPGGKVDLFALVGLGGHRLLLSVVLDNIQTVWM